MNESYFRRLFHLVWFLIGRRYASACRSHFLTTRIFIMYVGLFFQVFSMIPLPSKALESAQFHSQWRLLECGESEGVAFVAGVFYVRGGYGR